jgi:8-oxo-dGTP diphosphatase
VVRRGGRVLLCRRPLEKRHGGLWEFPGGKVEAAEDWTAALGRELSEELGVLVSDVGDELFAHADPGSSFLIHFVACEIVGEPECREHDAIEWVSEASLSDYSLAPADEAFAHSLVSVASRAT